MVVIAPLPRILGLVGMKEGRFSWLLSLALELSPSGL
jgi:hypothetical protein